MRPTPRTSILLPALLGALLLGTGCGDSNGTPTEPMPGEGTGTLTLEMTDAPIDGVSELWVYVSGIDLKPSGSPLVRLRPPELEAGLYDLLELRDGLSVILYDAGVPAVEYEFIEIELDEERSFLVETAEPGTEVPFRIASGKAKLAGGPFGVRRDGTTSVLFDFDAERSLRRKGNGDYLLKPVLRILRTSETG
ncbi:MAG: DUF4382 domain-containing protein [Thermoanaerobaculia bacterium]